ncbi:hypothetical protein IEO21_08625 [Rhodonia placenta]|uniref:Uncharacterized protein n=1 Tax=Rhodonia placenta TaxID=104341 RepID=A0A8H7NVW4_9APHY|nr:hypothetical protein IEO21_08625 [Postia placenta]
MVIGGGPSLNGLAFDHSLPSTTTHSNALEIIPSLNSMLWFQIATQLGIALLTFITHTQTYGNLYIPLTIGDFIDAAVPHILFIADHAAHSLLASSVPSLPAPPIRHGISAPQTTVSSKDLILWTPTGLPVSAGLHLPTLTAAPVPCLLTITEMRTHGLGPQLEYPTKDLVVWEGHTGELVDASGSTYFVTSGILAIAIICGACMIVNAFRSQYITTLRASFKAYLWSILFTGIPNADAGAAPPSNVELAWDGEDASVDVSDRELATGVINGSNAHVRHNKAPTMSLYPDTVAAHLDDGQAVDTQDIRCTERAQAGTGIEATGPHPPARIHGQDLLIPDVALLPQDPQSSSSTPPLPSASQPVSPSHDVAISFSTLLVASTQEMCDSYERRCKEILDSVQKQLLELLKRNTHTPQGMDYAQQHHTICIERNSQINSLRTQAEEARERLTEFNEAIAESKAWCDDLVSGYNGLELELEQELALERATATKEVKLLAQESERLRFARTQLMVELSRQRAELGLPKEEHTRTEEECQMEHLRDNVGPTDLEEREARPDEGGSVQVTREQLYYGIQVEQEAWDEPIVEGTEEQEDQGAQEDQMMLNGQLRESENFGNVEQPELEKVRKALDQEAEEESGDMRQTQLLQSDGTPSDERDDAHDPLDEQSGVAEQDHAEQLGDYLEDSGERFYKFLREMTSRAGDERDQESTTGEDAERQISEPHADEESDADSDQAQRTDDLTAWRRVRRVLRALWPM